MEQSAKITSPSGISASGIASKIRKFNVIKREKSAKNRTNLEHKKKEITKKEKLIGKRKTVQKKHNIVKFNPN